MSKDGGQGAEPYLELHVTSPSLRILVPERSLREVGVRDLATTEQVEAILGVLREPSDVPRTWSQRNVFTASRMRSTDLDQRCLVIRDLTRHVRRTGKALTMGENRALESCMDMVSSELSLVLGIPEADTRALIVDSCLADEAPSQARS